MQEFFFILKDRIIAHLPQREAEHIEISKEILAQAEFDPTYCYNSIKSEMRFS